MPACLLSTGKYGCFSFTRTIRSDERLSWIPENRSGDAEGEEPVQVDSELSGNDLSLLGGHEPFQVRAGGRHGYF